MKRFLLIFLLFIGLIGCKTDDEQFLYYRICHQNSLTTENGALLKSSVSKDTIVTLEDGLVTALGQIDFVEDDIIQYGHVWGTSKNNLVINKDSSNCTKFYTTKSNIDNKFYSNISDLKSESYYRLRSYAIDSKGNVGYNPIITEFKTPDPVNLWQDLIRFPFLSQRAGVMSCEAVIDDDTLLYIGFGNNKSECYKDFYVFNPKDNSYKKLAEFPGKACTEGIMVAQKYNDHTRILVGLGLDSDGNGIDEIYEYNADKDKWENQHPKEFPGGGRSGAVAFCLGGKIYIGLGRLGKDRNSGCCADFYMYNTEISKEISFYNMDEKFPGGARAGSSIFQFDNYVYLMMGEDNNYKGLKDVWKFTQGSHDLQINWEKVDCEIPEEFVGRAYAGEFKIGYSCYIGCGKNGNSLLSDFYKYDLTNKAWKRVRDYKNGEYQEYKNSGEELENIAPNASSQISYSFRGKGYVGLGYIGEAQYPKFTSTFWVYRP